MPGKFVTAKAMDRTVYDWGTTGWAANPPVTGAKLLTVLDVTLLPGKGHNFHKHPDQEEVIYVISGKVEQWVNKKKKLLGPGDTAFIPADMVHASFNVGKENAKIVAILGPCAGPIGYELVDVANKAPWKTMRRKKK